MNPQPVMLVRSHFVEHASGLRRRIDVHDRIVEERQVVPDGMPAYAKDGNVVCFFQCAQKFKTRYATLGFSDKASLDEGQLWPAAFALRELTVSDEARIGALAKKAVS